jgi:diaminohydroxyphosphoribosylaminopyrimidine deaminase/5-amino-6-(5-phosphoribosylamino)uracil reductase
MTEVHEQYMRRCLELAKQAAGFVAPNPLVGCAIVYEGKIIGEGFHQKFGEAHAEVNAIHSVSDPLLLQHSTLYVNLEPCSHIGKTPPCADLIIQKKIPEVIIGCPDLNPLVSGNGIRKLQAAKCKVQTGILEAESKELNKRFITFHKKKRPYIILKWAQTRDCFLAPKNNSRTNISNEFSRTLAHCWRSEEQSIMIGTNTALHDNPKLDARLWNNRNPVRVVLDRELKLPPSLNLFDHSVPTIVFTEKEKRGEENIGFIQLDFKNNLLENILHILYEMQIQSVLVEGGARLLQSLIEKSLWDEARIFIAPLLLHEGISAPKISAAPISEENIYGDQLIVIRNKS